MPEASNRHKDVFLQALELASPAEQAAFLREACGADLALREQLDAMLQAHAAADSFLEKPAAALSPTLDQPPPQAEERGGAERPGSRVGPYKLLQYLGGGGMGVVFLAEQQEPVRRMVALKIIRAGMDSAQVVARFEQERQALALMDHPNIAKVFDGGTTESGRPYFVMDLIKGVPMTRFCDQEHLTPRERLALFIPVCQAVQHAHQKGIIHRDLKPSNLLIALYDGKPVPKVIDFGVAKAASQKLTERTLFTEVGNMIGTLEYMAPEQAELNNLDIDTRADIYALGVLLYELLTGAPPFSAQQLRSNAFAEMLRIIREVEPPIPSTRLSASQELPAIAASRKLEPAKLTSQVRGELDWIVMKCLEKERGRRYETANAVALDIQRYLTDEPVQAGPPSAVYRLRKFVRRNRGAVTAAAAIAVAVMLGIVGTTWGWVDAVQARQDADLQRDHAMKARQDEADQRNVAVQALGEARDAAAARAKAEEQARRAETARAEDAARKTRLIEARLALERGMNRCESDQPADGLLWLARGLEAAPEDATQLRVSLRRLLAGWRSEVHPLKQILPTRGLTALSPDGKVLSNWLESNKSGAVQLRDAGTGKPLGELLPLPVPPYSVDFSPDSKLLVTASYDPSAKRDILRIWDVGTRRAVGEPILLEPKAQGSLDWVEVSPDGKRLAAMYGRDPDPGVYLWEMPTGKPITGRLSTKEMQTFAFSPDGKTLLTAGGVAAPAEVGFWDAQTGKPIGKPMTHNLEVRCATFSPDGKFIVLGGADGARGIITILERSTRMELHLHRTTFRHPVHRVDFGPDGKTLVAYCCDRAGDCYFQILHWLPTQNVLLRIHAEIRAASRFCVPAFLPDGKAVLLDDGAQARLWDTATAEPLGGPLPYRRVLYWATFEDGGKTVVLADDNDVRRRHVVPRAGRKLAAPDGMTFGARAFRPHGQTLAVATKYQERIEVRFWDPATGKPARAPLAFGKANGAVHHVAYSPDGKLLLTLNGSIDLQARLWNAVTHQLVCTIGEPVGWPRLVAFSPDSRRLLVVNHQSARLWDTVTGKAIGPAMRRDGQGPIIATSFSPDGRHIVVVGSAKTVFWDAASGQSIDAWDHAGTSHPNGKVDWVAYSPDGTKLITSGERSARLWDTATRKPIGGPIQHDTVEVTLPLTFSPDSKTILSAGNNHSVKARLWDAATGKPHGPYLPGTGGYPIHFSPDGKTIVSGTSSGPRWYDTASGQPMGKPVVRYQRFRDPVFYHRLGIDFVISSDSRTLAVKNRSDFPLGEQMLLFDVPQPLAGDPDRVRLWLEVSTGQQLDAGGEIATLDARTWQERYDRLQQLGGPP